MALTNSRPLNLLDNGENDILHNSASPIFQFNMSPSLGESMTSNIPTNTAASSTSVPTTTTTTSTSTITTTNNNSTTSVVPPINNMANTTTSDSNNVNNIPAKNHSLFPGSDIVDINDINPPISENTINDIMTPLNITAQTTPTSTPSAAPNKNPLSISAANNTGSIAATTSTTTASAATTLKKSNSTKTTVSNNPLNNPIVEISKLIPVTGERPRPVEDKSQFDDDVLFAVFIILYEMDPEQNGMTVKQLCDYLLVKHPEMSNLSTKLSNLISAKLNAYVKKIEKGEKTLTYAISREWSAASPRRMLYIYRGILAPDYKEQAQLVASKLKKQMTANIITTSTDKNNTNDKTNKKNSSTNIDNNVNNNMIVSLDSIPQNTDLTNFDTSNYNYRQINNLNFTFPPEFNIPYSTSPVSATLNNTSHEDNRNNSNMNYEQNASSLVNNVHNDENTNSNEVTKSNKKNGSQGNTKKRAANDLSTIPSSTPPTTNKNIKKNNDNMKTPNKRQKTSSNIEASYNFGNYISVNQTTPTDSQSTITTNNASNVSSSDGNEIINIHTNSDNIESNYITAVAAAPRISKYLPRSNFSTPNNSSTNIHQLLTLQTPILNSRSQSRLDEKNNSSTTTTSGDTSDRGNDIFNEESQEQKHKEEYWINIVRSGFLTKDIDKPESISIDDLDSMF